MGMLASPLVSTNSKEYDSFFIYVPAEVARDTQCPFKHGDKLKVIISGDAFIIEKVESR